MAHAAKKTPTKLPDKEYVSNPFTLTFNALGRLFKYNQVWAIVLIVFGILGFFWQIGTSLVDLATRSPSNYDHGSFSAASSSASTTSPETATIVAIIIIIATVLIFAIVIGTVVNTFVQGMFTYVALASEKEQNVSFGEAFSATAKRFWRLFGAQLLAGLKIFGWTLLFIVPGIIAALRYSLLPFVVMSEPESDGRGVSESHTRIKALTKGRLIEVFGINTVGAIIPVVGSLLTLAGGAALHNQLGFYHDNTLEKPKVHWLNYLGLILLGALLLFVLFITIVAVVILLAAKN